MALKEPESMEKLVYFTQRNIGDGHVKAWVYRGQCPKCGKGLMGKPVDPKTGKVKVRAKEYVCPECGYTADKNEYEETLTCEVKYACPKCGHEGEAEIPYKRKKVRIWDEAAQKKKSVDALQFKCEKCGEKINITKKLK